MTSLFFCIFSKCLKCEQQPTEEEEQEEEEVVQPEIEAVIVGEDVEEEEGVVLQDDGCPAVIVEEVPSAQVEECYSAQVLVYDDETYLMQDVAEEQEVVTEVAETGKDFVKFIWKYYHMISSKERLLGNFFSYNAHT